MMYLITAAAAFLVGASIGICGVAGFLLPIFFVGYWGLDSSSALFLSFGCFLISGIVGAVSYRKQGALPENAALPLGLSSLVGGLCGALVGQVYVSAHIKTVLYVVVLLSGLMIFVQDFLSRKSGDDRREIRKAVLLPLGFITAMICALSGAGGPVMVMPLLVLLGLSVREAVGLALFDSVFIAVPSIFVYGSRASFADISLLLPVSLLAHGAGIFCGSAVAGRVPQRPLKFGVAVFSVLFSAFMLFA